jgi:hypothetical protein
VLTPKIDKKKPIEYTLERIMLRPRDVIDFFNVAIRRATDKARISAHMLKEAEGEYSRLRLRSLEDEWQASYPNLDICLQLLFKSRKPHGLVGDFDDDACREFCLELIVNSKDSNGRLIHYAEDCFEDRTSAEQFRQNLFKVFYLVGAVGLKLGPSEPWTYAKSEGRNISEAEISDSTHYAVHPMFHRALGIKR